MRFTPLNCLYLALLFAVTVFVGTRLVDYQRLARYREANEAVLAADRRFFQVIQDTGHTPGRQELWEAYANSVWARQRASWCASGTPPVCGSP